MSNLVNSLLETANPYTSIQKDAARLAGKWGKSGLLEGISNETDKSNMAIILENQAKQLVVESSATGTGGTFTAGTGEQYAAVALPLVRKVFGQIAAKEFVSVQPMSLPAGLVFFLDFQYGTNVDPFNTTAGTNSLYGNQTANFGNDRAGGLYGAGRFGYSINQFSGSNASGTIGLAAGTGVTKATLTVSTASWADVSYDNDLSASAVAGTIRALTLPTSSILGADPNAIRSFVVSGSGAFASAKFYPQFTQLDLVNGNVTYFLTSSAAEVATAVAALTTVFFSKGPKDNSRGDFEDASGAGFPNAESQTAIVIPEINVQMRSEAIVAKTRKLKAQWTPEFSQDLNAFHSLDAEAELTSILSEYISLEIDLEILDMLIQNVPTNQVEVWSAKVGNQLNAAKTGFDANTSGVYYTQMSWFQTLGIKLQKISNIIHQRTLRGGANFIVISPTIATVLESIPGFAADTDGDSAKMSYAFGVQKIGQLNSRYKVYKNPYMLENTILMGFRGNQFLESGAVYAPYVPLIMTPLVYDPNTFTPRKGIMTRYAKKMVRPEFYGKVIVADTNFI
jgi:hypothetical protein